MALLPNPRKIMLVIIAFAMVMATCVAGVWVWWHLRVSTNTRYNTRALLIAWQAFYSTTKDAETGVRGYVLTEEEQYLEPFEEAVRNLPAQMLDITRLETLITTDQNATRSDMVECRRLVDEVLSRLRELLTVTRREGREQAIALIKGDEAKETMDTLRGLCERELETLDMRLRKLDSEVESWLKWGGLAIALLGLAAIIAGIASWMMLLEALTNAQRAERLDVEKLKAETANREKSSFLATMSHEIRTPMNAILGFGELLKDELTEDKQKRYAESIVRGGRALLELINDILDLSKIEAGMLEFTPAPLNLRELADFTRQLFSQQCSAKGINLMIHVDESVPTSLLLDGARLRQIVINLVGNAVKFTKIGQVSLQIFGTRSSGNRSSFDLEICVKDTGIGIAQAQIERIFEPFVQAGHDKTMDQKGTGLGLSIVKRLTTMMGGSMTVRSKLNEGSTFTVKLPQVEISAKLAQPTEAAIVPVDFDLLIPSKILIVDDNPVNLELITGYFEGTAHDLTTARNGQEALNMLIDRRPDVVLMDIRMPVMDGRTALSELRKRADLALLPVIAVTASSMAREEDDLRAAFDGYLRKPFSRAELFQELCQFIGRRPPANESSHFDGVAPSASWIPLITRLKEIESGDLPGIRAGMVLSEVNQLATSLRQIAKAADCPPLDSFAANIHSLAESFSLDKLEVALASLPVFISELETHCAALRPK